MGTQTILSNNYIHTVRIICHKGLYSYHRLEGKRSNALCSDLAHGSKNTSMIYWIKTAFHLLI